MKHLLLVMLAAGVLFGQDPASARDWLNRGVTFYKNGQYADAIAAFQKAVDLDPSFMNGYLYLGTAYMQTYIPGAQTPENDAAAANAHAAFQKVLALDAGNKIALQSEASLFLNQKQWDAAKAAFERVINADPNNADAYYSLGFIAWSQWYPAYGKARAAVGLKPSDPGPLPDPAIRADLKARFDQVIEDGEMALNKALALRPNYSDAMAYLNLLVRERADLRDTSEAYQSDIRVADDWVQKALEAKRIMAERRGTGPATAVPPPPPPPPPAGGGSGATRRIILAAEPANANLLTRVEPLYPPLALQARVSGSVTLQLVIGTDGRTKELQVVSGQPLLIMAALDAVKQWVYSPTYLNGQPVEVQTVVTVPFRLPE